jgi:hypothetical protein
MILITVEAQSVGMVMRNLLSQSLLAKAQCVKIGKDNQAVEHSVNLQY